LLARLLECMYESVNSVWHLTCFFKIVVVVHLIVRLDFWRESLCGCPLQQFNFKWTRLVFASLSSDTVFVSHRLHVGELELSISRCYWFLVLIVLPSTRYFFPGDFGFYRLSLNSEIRLRCSVPTKPCDLRHFWQRSLTRYGFPAACMGYALCNRLYAVGLAVS